MTLRIIALLSVQHVVPARELLDAKGGRLADRFESRPSALRAGKRLALKNSAVLSGGTRSEFGNLIKGNGNRQ